MGAAAVNPAAAGAGNALGAVVSKETNNEAAGDDVDIGVEAVSTAADGYGGWG